MKAGCCCLLLLLAGLSAARPAGAAPRLPADAEIRFWEARQERDPYDYTAPARLAAAYARKAREGGEFAYYRKAESASKKALALNPEHYSALVLLASAYAAQHRFRDAAETAAKAAALQPEKPDAYAALGDAYLELGDTTRAETAFRTLARKAPGFFADTRAARLLQLKGDVAGARARLARAIAGARAQGVADADVAWAEVQLGELYFGSGDFKAAEKHYRAALKILPESFLATEHLAELKASEGRSEEALRLYEKVVAATPAPQFYEAIGQLHAGAGRPAEAAKWYDRALEGYRTALQQGDVGYYRHLSRFYVDARKSPADALEWARKDLEVRQDIHTYDTLAWALYQNGDDKEAAEMIKKALALGTKDADLLFHAGMIYARLGEPGAARKYLERALAANPRFARAGEARKTLRTLASAT